MIDWITSLYAEFTVFSKENPVIGGVLALWLAGSLTFFMKDTPKAIWTFIKEQTITNMYMDNTPWTEIELHYYCFLEWFYKSSWSSYSRNISLMASSSRSDDSKFGAGYGLHFFIFRRRLFWFKRTRVESGSVSFQKEYINISTFGRDLKKLEELFEEFKFRDSENSVKVRKLKKSDWVTIPSVKKRSLDSVVVNQEVLDKIMAAINDVFENKEWYESRSLPAKVTICLYGPPGTGKTSLIKALAAYFNVPLYIGSLNVFSIDVLEEAMVTMSRPAFLLFEDIADCEAVLATDNKYKQITRDIVKLGGNKTTVGEEESHYERNEHALVKKSEVLNFFDGVVPLDDIVTFITTNDIELIDPVLLRRGRVDLSCYIGKLSDREIRKYLCRVYELPSVEYEGEFEEISGCDLEAVFKENRNNFNEALNALIKKPVSNGL